MVWEHSCVTVSLSSTDGDDFGIRPGLQGPALDCKPCELLNSACRCSTAACFQAIIIYSAETNDISCKYLKKQVFCCHVRLKLCKLPQWPHRGFSQSDFVSCRDSPPQVSSHQGEVSWVPGEAVAVLSLCRGCTQPEQKEGDKAPGTEGGLLPPCHVPALP